VGCHQIAGRHIESAGDPVSVDQGDIPFVALHPAPYGPPGSVGGTSRYTTDGAAGVASSKAALIADLSRQFGRGTASGPQYGLFDRCEKVVGHLDRLADVGVCDRS
jgi:hypothetical protein